SVSQARTRAVSERRRRRGERGKLKQPERVTIAMSYARPQGKLVERVVKLLKKSLSGEEVFYDKHPEFAADTSGFDVHAEVLRKYADSELVVAVLSADYAASKWCLAEWRVIRNRRLHREGERLMLLRCDEAAIPDLLEIDQ